MTGKVTQKKKDYEYICGKGNERKDFFYGAKFLLGYFLCTIKWEMVIFCVFITLIKANFTLTETYLFVFFITFFCYKLGLFQL